MLISEILGVTPLLLQCLCPSVEMATGEVAATLNGAGNMGVAEEPQALHHNSDPDWVMYGECVPRPRTPIPLQSTPIFSHTREFPITTAGM